MSTTNGKQFKNFDDLAPQQEEFGFHGRRFILREASHASARAYRSAVLGSYRQSQDGSLIPSERTPESETLLVASCCVEIKQDGKEYACSTDDVCNWPNRAVAWAFQTIKESSMLTDRDLSSPESIQKEVDRLSKLLAQIKQDKEDGGEAGNSQTSGNQNSG